MKKAVISIALLTIMNLCLSQNIVMSGYVNCAQTGEKLVGANIYNKASGLGTSTNNSGYFSLILLPVDSVEIVVSFIGYTSIETRIPTNKNLRFDIDLRPGYLLNEVLIEETNKHKIENRPEISRIRLSIQQIKTLPSIGGETDILKLIQNTPGVKSGGEWSTGLYVRGGSSEQNLFLLDNTPLYNVSHLGGFVSTFNSDALKNVEFIKGGFPANYGNRLSSVLDVQMKDGNSKEFNANVSVGMMSSKIFLEAPVKPDTSSYIISYRRFMYDLIMLPVSKAMFKNDQSFGYTFYDLNLKFNHNISSKTRLFVSAYFGEDVFQVNQFNRDYKSKSELNWGNSMVSVRINNILSKALFSNFSVSYVEYQSVIATNSIFKQDTSITKQHNSINSKIGDIISNLDFEYSTWKNAKIKFGLTNTIHSFNPAVINYNISIDNQIITDTTLNNEKIRAVSNSAFLLLESFIGKQFSSNCGIRLSHYYVNGKNYINPEPRILLNYNLKKIFAIKASYDVMRQNVNVLSSGIGIPYEMWFPATDKISPAKSQQISFGIAKSFFNNSIELSIEGYYKELENLITYKTGNMLAVFNGDWTNLVETEGIGKSKGLEFLLQKTKGRLTGLFGYTLSKATRQFENINNGKEYIYKYDRTHDAGIMLSYQISDKLNISSTWVYGTGNAYSLPVGQISTVSEYYDVNNNGLFNYSTSAHIYDGVNNYRMRDYHRLDIGINHTKSVRYGQRTLNFSIYNIYNRQNPFYYYLNFHEGRQEYELRQQSLFPIMPSVSYTLNFNKADIDRFYAAYKEKKHKYKKHRIGGQINPFIGTDSGFRQLVYAVRYSYGISSFMTFGLEYSGNKLEKYSANNLQFTSKNKNYGGFIRITYPKAKYVQAFFETNLYYTQNIQTRESDDYRSVLNDYSGFIAPGISFIIMNQDVNIDIFYKISNKEIVKNKNSVISYRVCVNF
jgi:hypothetical protein